MQHRCLLKLFKKRKWVHMSKREENTPTILEKLIMLHWDSLGPLASFCHPAFDLTKRKICRGPMELLPCPTQLRKISPYCVGLGDRKLNRTGQFLLLNQKLWK